MSINSEIEEMLEADRREEIMDYDPIYPLARYKGNSDDVGEFAPTELSVKQRLAPIFSRLFSDPEGWEYEGYNLGWFKVSCLPSTHTGCDNFRLVPKKPETITVEIPVPDRFATDGCVDECSLIYHNEDRAEEAEKAIREAMEKINDSTNPLFVCPECGGYVKWDRNSLLMSSPTQYRGTCESCHHIEFAFSETVDKAMEGK